MKINNLKYVYAGNCVNSFDDDGQCINDSIVFEDVTEFAQADEEENREYISKDQFLNVIDVNEPATKNILNKLFADIHMTHFKFFIYSDQKILVLYDDNADIHHFFV